MFFPTAFVGDFGQQMKNLYHDQYNTDPVGYSAFAFDAALTAGNAIDFMISKGISLSQSHLFMNAIRKVKFRGATGNVTIDMGKNDRSPMSHTIVNT